VQLPRCVEHYPGHYAMPSGIPNTAASARDGWARSSFGPSARLEPLPRLLVSVRTTPDHGAPPVGRHVPPVDVRVDLRLVAHQVGIRLPLDLGAVELGPELIAQHPLGAARAGVS